MIIGFGNRLAEDLWCDRRTAATRQFPPELRAVARRKLQYLNAAARLGDLRVPPGNRLKALAGDLAGCHPIRINDQFRVVFRWRDGATDVRVMDYH